MILPNTDYFANRDEFGLVSSRGQSDDFEYVPATNTMTFGENLEMQGFLLWARRRRSELFAFDVPAFVAALRDEPDIDPDGSAPMMFDLALRPLRLSSSAWRHPASLSTRRPDHAGQLSWAEPRTTARRSQHSGVVQ
jgi:hypothetical protein